MDLKNKTVTSAMFAINWKDGLRGLLISVVTGVLTVIQNSAMAEQFIFDKSKVISAAIFAGVAYLLKNFFTPASIQIPIKDAEINPNDPKSAK